MYYSSVHNWRLKLQLVYLKEICTHVYLIKSRASVVTLLCGAENGKYRAAMTTMWPCFSYVDSSLKPHSCFYSDPQWKLKSLCNYSIRDSTALTLQIQQEKELRVQHKLFTHLHIYISTFIYWMYPNYTKTRSGITANKEYSSVQQVKLN